MWTEIVRPSQRKKNQKSIVDAVAQQAPTSSKTSVEAVAYRPPMTSAAEMTARMAPRGSKITILTRPPESHKMQQKPPISAVMKRTANPTPVKPVKASPLPVKPVKDVQKASKDAGKNYDLMMFVKTAGSNTKMSSHTKDTTPLDSKVTIKKAVVVNEEFVKHRFIPTKKKKKVFSNIKKRILMERLRYQMKQQAALHRATTSCKLESSTLGAEIESHLLDPIVNTSLCDSDVMHTVIVSYFVTEQDIRDESEYEEIISNIEQIFNPFGALESITIMVTPSTEEPVDESAISEESSAVKQLDVIAHDDNDDDDDDSLDRECIVFVSFLKGDAAAAAAIAINGSQFSGKSISASLINIAPELFTSDNGNDDKMSGNVKQYKANRMKTKIMIPVVEENSNSISDKVFIEGCPILTPATATATAAAAATATATAAATAAKDILISVDSKYTESAAESLDAASNIILGCQCDLYLEQAVCKDDVADEDEAYEILSDLHSLCQVFGTISDVWVSQGKEKKRFHSNLMINDLTTTGIMTTGESEVLEGPWIFMEFDNLICASRAVCALNGRHIGGEVLEALHYNYDAYQCEMYDSRYCVRAVEDNDEGIDSKSKTTVDVMHGDMMCECDDGAVVLVRNYVSAEDLEDCAGHGHGEEIAVMKKDLLLLCTAQSQSSLSDGLMERSIRRITILSSDDLNCSHGHGDGHKQSVVDGETAYMNTSNSNTDSNNDNNDNNDNFNDINDVINDNNNNNGNNKDSKNDNDNINNDSNDNDNNNNDAINGNNGNSDNSNSNSNSTSELTACVRFNSITAATDAMLTLDGTLLSGNTLKASIRIVTPKSLLLTGPAIVLHVNYPDVNQIKTTSLTAPSTSTLTITLASNSSFALKELLPVESIKLNSVLSDSVDVDRGSGIPATTSVCEINENVKVQDPRVSVYTEAVLAPKLKKNTVTDGMIKIAVEEVDGWVKDFLSSIATFQERLKEKDPLKAAAKRRFVMGIKQATNCVRAGSVKLLLLAPDSEDSVAIDSVLDTLKEIALEKEVPVLYCLNRRKLGKAAHSSMKQLAVAVLDADGAYDIFKKILHFINQPPPE